MQQADRPWIYAYDHDLYFLRTKRTRGFCFFESGPVVLWLMHESSCISAFTLSRPAKT